MTRRAESRRKTRAAVLTAPAAPARHRVTRRSAAPGIALARKSLSKPLKKLKTGSEMSRCAETRRKTRAAAFASDRVGGLGAVLAWHGFGATASAWRRTQPLAVRSERDDCSAERGAGAAAPGHPVSPVVARARGSAARQEGKVAEWP